MEAIQIIDGYIQQKHGTAAEWASENPVLMAWEFGIETDTRRGKIGDGVTAWNSLPYAFRTYDDFVGSGSTAAAGLVPEPPDTIGSSKFLREDGEWAEPLAPISGNAETATALKTTAISANADLNNYNTAGNYTSANSTRTGTLSHCPHSGSGFTMLVLLYGNYGVQLIFASNGKMYQRNKTSSGWGAWYLHQGTAV